MSLALFRERIEAGDLDAQAREHLKTCTECRELYDKIANVSRALGDDGATQERARLLKALPLERAESGKMRQWGIVGLAVAAAALLFVLMPRSSSKTSLDDDETSLRGTDSVQAPFSLRLYYQTVPNSPLRLAGDFPGSKEAQINVGSQLLFFVKPGNARIAVDVRDGDGGTRILHNEPSEKTMVPVGEIIDTRALGTGTFDVCAWLDPSSPTDGDAARTRYCGKLRVLP